MSNRTAEELYRELYGNGVFRELPVGFSMHRRFFVRDDFEDYVTAHRNWTSAIDGTTPGTAAVGDAANGVLALTTAAEDNKITAIGATHKHFVASAIKRLAFEVYLKITEANTDDANVAVGLSSVVGTTILGDDGAGPIANYSGMLFFKVDGGAVWQFETSNATAQVTSTDVGDVVSGRYIRLGFTAEPNAAGDKLVVTPFVDGVAQDSHELAIASLAAMGPVLAVKAGGANAEVLSVDYILVAADR